MDGWAQLISTLGFPIFAACALGFFIWKISQKLMEENKAREQKYIEIIAQSNAMLTECQNTNAKFLETLGSMQECMKHMQEDVDDIKDILHIKEAEN